MGGRRRLLSAILCGMAGLLVLVAVGTRSPAVSPSPGSGARGLAVVATRQLEPGSVIAAADVALGEVSAGPGLAGAMRSRAEATGRRLLIGIVGGAVIPASAVAAALLGDAEGRRLRVTVDAVDLAPDVAPGGSAELVVALEGQGGSRKVESVAIVEVIDVAPAAGGSDAPGPASTRRDGDGRPGGEVSRRRTVALRCAPPDALRVVWASRFGRALALLSHPAGAPTLPPGAGGA